MTWTPDDAVTLEAVERRVEAMGELVGAGALVEASRYERVLWRDVLEAISDGGRWDKDDLAACALKTRRYRFTRYP